MIKSGSRLILMGVLLIALSCSSAKSTVEAIVPMLVTLEDAKDGEYLKNTYSDYNIQDIKPANKTLNQYQVKFACNSKQKEKLLQLMEKDLSIKELLLITETAPTIETGSSGKASKVGPIRKN